MLRVFIIMGIFSSLFGCNKDDSAELSPVVVTNEDEHNMIYERGCKLIYPHMQLLDRAPKVNRKVKQQVSRGIADLDAVTAYKPENWAAYWIKGKGYQVLGDAQAANAEFKASFAIQKENPDVAREYASTCLDLGQAGEAARATEHAIKLTPDDAGLYANLALALLIDGKHTEAREAVSRSLQMAPGDKISQAVLTLVDDVISGKKPQPNNMADLHKR
ncbi:MAG: hypothetical protein CMO55_12590 [Verrucomicrobiales bacterium]|nr:hypothetical protein [Verrucomicrobiales bacterium]